MEEGSVPTERLADDEQVSGGCGIMIGIRRSDQVILFSALGLVRCHT
jgi:hypothetical protein